MSAWIVSKGHIDCLVQSMVVEGIVPMDEATAAGILLWEENHRSVDYRYSERNDRTEYVFEGIEAPLEDWIVWRQLDCYEYQTCEHDVWDDPTNPARRLHDQLEAVYRARYGCESSHDLHAPQGGEPLLWGIDDIKEAIRKE